MGTYLLIGTQENMCRYRLEVLNVDTFQNRYFCELPQHPLHFSPGNGWPACMSLYLFCREPDTDSGAKRETHHQSDHQSHERLTPALGDQLPLNGSEK